MRLRLTWLSLDYARFALALINRRTGSTIDRTGLLITTLARRFGRTLVVLRRRHLMLYVVLIVVVVALGVALWWGARKCRDADEEIKDMNQGRGPGRGIFGVFGKGRNDRNS
jgi:hypothetical protein